MADIDLMRADAHELEKAFVEGFITADELVSAPEFWASRLDERIDFWRVHRVPYSRITPSDVRAMTPPRRYRVVIRKPQNRYENPITRDDMVKDARKGAWNLSYRCEIAPLRRDGSLGVTRANLRDYNHVLVGSREAAYERYRTELEHALKCCQTRRDDLERELRSMEHNLKRRLYEL